VERGPKSGHDALFIEKIRDDCYRRENKPHYWGGKSPEEKSASEKMAITVSV